MSEKVKISALLLTKKISVLERLEGRGVLMGSAALIFFFFFLQNFFSFNSEIKKKIKKR